MSFEYIPPCESEKEYECSNFKGFYQENFSEDNSEYKVTSEYEIPENIVIELMRRNHINTEFITSFRVSEFFEDISKIKLVPGNKVILEQGDPNTLYLEIGKTTYILNISQLKVNKVIDN